MRITWITRSFLDYRIPVYQEIDRLFGHQLTVIYFADVVPQRCQDKLKAILGDRAVGISGEIRIGGKKRENQTFANKGGIRIPLRPGLINLVNKTKPDVMLSDGFFQWTYAPLWIRKWENIPHVMCYERTLHTERGVSSLRHFARKIASRYIDRICANGSQTKNYLIQFGYPAAKISLGNMAADYSNLQKAIVQKSLNEIIFFKDQNKLEGEIFLYLGQLIERKGILHLLKAWKIFSKNKENINLLLVGEGDQRGKIEEFISENNLKNVVVSGKVDYDEVVNYYAAADIFLIPTLEDNWSLVVPEAMSCGLPIISSKYNGCWPELVKPENGWVFDPLDQSDFIETLENAWGNKEKWKDMGQKSKEIVAMYSPEKVAGNIYNTCLQAVTK